MHAAFQAFPLKVLFLERFVNAQVIVPVAGQCGPSNPLGDAFGQAQRVHGKLQR